MGWVYIEEQKLYCTAVLGFSAMKAKICKIIFVRFLVQMKTLEYAFKINCPLGISMNTGVQQNNRDKMA